MPTPVRLARYVADLARCSRIEAEQYIKNGWVSVDGRVSEDPAQPVLGNTVALDAAAQLEAIEPATVLLHKPAGYDTISGRNMAAALVQPGNHWPEDPSGVRVLERHFQRLTPLVPLDAEASGLMFDPGWPRVAAIDRRRRHAIEQEFVVEVSGNIAPYGLRKLNHGLHYNGRALPPCKVSWQNEIRLRFALKGVQGGQLRDMCAQVGLNVVAIRRLRIGKVALAKMPVGLWRYLAGGGTVLTL